MSWRERERELTEALRYLGTSSFAAATRISIEKYSPKTAPRSASTRF
jgi:hypothetical protein